MHSPVPRFIDDFNKLAHLLDDCSDKIDMMMSSLQNIKGTHEV